MFEICDDDELFVHERYLFVLWLDICLQKEIVVCDQMNEETEKCTSMTKVTVTKSQVHFDHICVSFILTKF